MCNACELMFEFSQGEDENFIMTKEKGGTSDNSRDKGLVPRN